MTEDANMGAIVPIVEPEPSASRWRAGASFVAFALGLLALLGVYRILIIQAPAPEIAREDEIRKVILRWFSRIDYDPNEHDPVQYGAAAIPVVVQMLEAGSPRDGEVHGALGLIDRLPVPKNRRIELAVARYLPHERTVIRAMAARAMAKVGGTQDVPAIIQMLSDDDLVVRATAIRTLGEIGDRSTVHFLLAWHGQAEKHDIGRPLPERWLLPEIETIYQDAVQALAKR